MVARMQVKSAQLSHGCWVEGSRGWTGSARVVDFARDFGMPFDADDQEIYIAFMASQERTVLPSGEDVDVTECMIGQGNLSDKAEEWLNENIVPEGWAFGWNDGEFFLRTTREWAEVSD